MRAGGRSTTAVAVVALADRRRAWCRWGRWLLASAAAAMLASSVVVQAFPPVQPPSSRAIVGPKRRRHRPQEVQQQQQQHPQQRARRPSASAASFGLDAAKGFGFGGGGSSMGPSGSKKKGTSADKSAGSNKSGRPVDPLNTARTRRVEERYGGGTPEQIAAGTQALIDSAVRDLPAPLREALPLHRRVVEWDRRAGDMDLLARSQVSAADVREQARARATLDGLLADHGLTVDDLQVAMQQITWDSSADAKAARSLGGSLTESTQTRLERACRHAFEAIADVTGGGTVGDEDDDSHGPRGDCLDVGCGYGVLVPYLRGAGIAPSQIHGVDLSPEMVRNARSFHPNVRFDVANFMELGTIPASSGGSPPKRRHHLYKAIVFCASLHDLPDARRALLQARDLLHPGGGRLIIVHPQGASHVAKQHRSNPVMVPRGLPTTEELREWLCDDDIVSDDGLDGNGQPGEASMELLVEPAEARSEREQKEGYLAVLRKR